MKERHDNPTGPDSRTRGLLAERAFSRREFLKIAGVAGAAIGASAGLGGILAGCGGDELTTTTAPPVQPPSSEETTTTTVSAEPEMGRAIKIGFVTPITGAISAFGIPDAWCLERWREFAGDGLVCGDGKKHPITFIDRDSQSDSNRAAQVTGDLITNDRVDIMMAAATPDTTIPVADQCEALETPCLSTDTPREAYFFGRGGDPAVGFKWTYHLFWGFWELFANSLDLWGQLETNKKVGVLWPNDVDGNAYRMAYPSLIEENGYMMVDGGSFPPGLEDYTSMISRFKSEGCEIINCIMSPPDFVNFWKQSQQQAFYPKIVDASKPTLFPSAMEAIGPTADGLAGPCWFHPTYPFRSSLTGESCFDLCLDFAQRTGMQWQQPILHYNLFEWAVDVLKRVTNVDDKEEIVGAISTTKMDMTIHGPFDFTAPVQDGTKHSLPNVVSTPFFEGQWVLNQEQKPWDTKVHQFDLIIVGNVTAPEIPVQAPLKPLPDSV